MFFNNFGMLFQGGALFDSLTVWQNIAFKLLNNGQKVSKKEALDAAQLLLQDVGLNENVSNMMPAELSGGMQKRVALARAFRAREPLLASVCSRWAPYFFPVHTIVSELAYPLV